MTKNKRAKAEARRLARQQGIPYVTAARADRSAHARDRRPSARLRIPAAFAESILAVVAALVEIPPPDQAELDRAVSKVDRLLILAVGDVGHGYDHLVEMKALLDAFSSAAVDALRQLKKPEVAVQEMSSFAFRLPVPWQGEAWAGSRAIARQRKSASFPVDLLPAFIVAHAALIRMGRQGLADLRDVIAPWLRPPEEGPEPRAGPGKDRRAE